MVIKRRQPITEQVISLLRGRIRSREYGDGRLPSESELALEMEVSRATIRTALSRLEAEGLVNRRQGDGTYVNQRIRDVKNHIDENIVLEEWTLPLSVDQVIWSQGADPAVMRRRRPQVIRIAEDAVAQEAELVHPVLLYRRIPVTGFAHDRLTLAGGSALKGEVIGKYLAAADEVIVTIFTIGGALDERMAETMQACLPTALALDAMGTAAVDELGRQARSLFQDIAQAEKMNLSMCFSPGMLGWPLEEGQPQIFGLLDAGRIGVSVAETGHMTPRKTVSAVFGLGSRLSDEAVSPCEFCAVRETCTYRGRHEEFEKISR
ncbi:MAG: GntR family transcriptional regulator [Anaerolineaceae bacterium]|jgi:DNA-binding transcriptional regulator YhcF (GntR family)|nr:GntR family transcriptional regulator [Anaerolineaceae bacterium]